MTCPPLNVFDRICRTCLNADGELLPIFSKGQHVSNLPKKIMASIRFKISEDDELPKMMCKKCIFLADSFYCFKQQCESANEKLKKFYKMMTEGKLGAGYRMDEYIHHYIYGGQFERDDTRYETTKENTNAESTYDSEDDYFVEYISEEVKIEVENSMKRKRDAQRKVEMARLSKIIKKLEDVEVVPVSTCRATANSRNKNADKQDIVVFPLKKSSCTASSNNDNDATRNRTDSNLMKRKIPSYCTSEKTYCHDEKRNKVSAMKGDNKCLNYVNSLEAASVKDDPFEILTINDNVSNNILMDQKHIGHIHNHVPVEMGVSQNNRTTQDAAVSTQTVQEKGIDSRAKQREETNNNNQEFSIVSETGVDKVKAENEKLDFHLGTAEDYLQVVAGEVKAPKSLASSINDVDKMKSITGKYSKNNDTVDIIDVSDEENSAHNIINEEGLCCLSNVTHKEETNVSEDIQDFKTSGKARECHELYLIKEIRKKEEFLIVADMESSGTKLKILDGNLNLYQCTICKSNFASMPNVLKHNVQEHMTNQNDYSCLVCKEVFKDKSLLLVHVEQHSDLKSYRCSFCPKAFTIQKDMKKHVHRHFNEKPLSANHQSTRTSKPLFICQPCSLVFGSKSQQDAHLAMIHNRLMMVTCEYCKTQFPRTRIDKDHGKMNDVQVSCDKKLSQQSCLKTQLNDQTFICPTCGEAVNQRKISHDHPSTQTNGKLYKCNDCSASFTDSSGLKKHIALHAKDSRRLHCEKCKKKFDTVYELRKHMRDRHKRFSQSKDISKEDNLWKTAKEVADANGESEKKLKEGQDVACRQVQFDVAGSDAQGKSEGYD